MRQRQAFIIIAAVVCGRLLLFAWRFLETAPRSVPPIAQPPTGPVGEWIPDSVADVPDCPPELAAAFVSNALTIEPLPVGTRALLPVWPADAAAIVAERYAGPVHLWCLGQLSSFASDSEPVPPTAVYVATGVVDPVGVVLINAGQTGGSVLMGVAGPAVAEWLEAQPR